MSAPTESDQALKRGQAENFDGLNDVLAGTPFDKHLRFFNFGYRPLEGEDPVGPTLGPLFPNKESAQLLFQLIGDADITDRDVVEVGCGRGGNLWLADRYFGAGQAIGLDIAHRSMVYAATTGQPPGAQFVQADAERLPLADASADVVLNVETSCTYPDLASFLLEVARILRPGGWFLYTDLLDRRLFEPLKAALDTAGFDLVTERDITPNVQASRNARAERQKLAFVATDGDARSATFDEFVADTGSTLARYLEGEERIYHILRLRKRDVPATTEPLFDEADTALIRECAAETVRLLDLSTPSPA